MGRFARSLVRRFVGASLLAATLNIGVYAQVSGAGAWVPEPGNTMPFYFSGTFNKASGAVSCENPHNGQPNWIASPRLKVGLSLVILRTVKECMAISGKPQLVTLALLGSYDSTWFTDSSLNKVRTEAEDRFGNCPYAENTAQPENKTFTQNDGYFAAVPCGKGAAEVESTMTGSTYSFTKHGGINRTHDDVFQKLEDEGVHYVSAHGVGGTLHETPWTDPSTGSKDCVFAKRPQQSYEVYRAYWNGPPLYFPPINFGRPPVHFAMIDCCEPDYGRYEPGVGTGHGLFESLSVPYF